MIRTRSYDLTKATDTKAEAAKKLFKYVAGVMNGSYQLQHVAFCKAEVLLWTPDARGEFTFEVACAALASAIAGNCVDPRGIQVLQELLPGSKQGLPHGLLKAIGRDIEEVEEEAGDVDDPFAMMGGMGAEELYKITEDIIPAPAVTQVNKEEEKEEEKEEVEEEAGDVDDPFAMMGGMGAEELYKITQMQEEAAPQPTNGHAEQATADSSAKPAEPVKEYRGWGPQSAAKPKEQPKAQAKPNTDTTMPIFKTVTGMLNAAYTLEKGIEMASKQPWARSVPLAEGETLSLTTLCNALATAIEAGKVPAQGAEVLQKLVKEDKCGIVPQMPATLLKALKIEPANDSAKTEVAKDEDDTEKSKAEEPEQKKKAPVATQQKIKKKAWADQQD